MSHGYSKRVQDFDVPPKGKTSVAFLMVSNAIATPGGAIVGLLGAARPKRFAAAAALYSVFHSIVIFVSEVPD
jgi:hypothetical protein